jgi:3'-phosphoadenosine 5'-phosphosulfate sulfotransferase (PAPS reductase)/FAD synthetase
MKESVAFYSGGKNSAAMVHRLDALGKTPDLVVFADTGIEFSETYETIEKFEQKTGIEVIWEKTDLKFEDWFYKPYSRGYKFGQIHGFPMEHNPCYWQRETKGRVFEKYYKKYDLVFVGFAADELHRKMNRGKHEYPLQGWGFTEDISLQYCRKHGIDNPLYYLGFPRLGCWCCPYQSAKSLRILHTYLQRKSPESWKWLKKLEKDSPHGFKTDFRLSSVENYTLEHFGLMEAES